MDSVESKQYANKVGITQPEQAISDVTEATRNHRACHHQTTGNQQRPNTDNPYP